jgi:hypothetical protein
LALAAYDFSALGAPWPEDSGCGAISRVGPEPCMPYHDLFPFMYLTYVVAGTVFLLTVSTVLIRLLLARVLRGSSPRKPLGEEFVWTLVPALIFVGLTVLGEIPHGWAKFAAGQRGAEMHARLAR